MERMMEFARAVFEKTRLRMLKVLLDREMCVCEIAEVFGLSQPRASQHLRLLRQAGAIDERREGKWVIYSANRETIEAFTRSWLEYQRTPLHEAPEFAAEWAALQSERYRKLREVCEGEK